MHTICVFIFAIYDTYMICYSFQSINCMVFNMSCRSGLVDLVLYLVVYTVTVTATVRIQMKGSSLSQSSHFQTPLTSMYTQLLLESYCMSWKKDWKLNRGLTDAPLHRKLSPLASLVSPSQYLPVTVDQLLNVE